MWHDNKNSPAEDRCNDRTDERRDSICGHWTVIGTVRRKLVRILVEKSVHSDSLRREQVRDGRTTDAQEGRAAEAR